MYLSATASRRVIECVLAQFHAVHVVDAHAPATVSVRAISRMFHLPNATWYFQSHVGTRFDPVHPHERALGV
eukprot:1923160-Prymnesium_polylepis.1